MKDFFGNDLYPGDMVGFSSYKGSGLGKGIITKLNKKLVSIKVGEWAGQDHIILRDPTYLIKNTGNYLGSE